MKFNLLAVAIVGCSLLLSCNNAKQADTKKIETPKEVKEEKKITFINKGHELVYNTVQKVGNIEQLKSKKDVVYTYTYQTPDGKADISTEKYIFDGELSYGAYNKHGRTFTDLEGLIEQGYDGNEYWLKHKGDTINDPKRLKRVAFNRPTNFYWFSMLPKLLDPGLNYEHLGEKTVEDKQYDIVKVSFNTKDDKPTDIYQVYINQKTLLIDQFLFTVADFGKLETPLLMQVSYENVEGLLIPTKRKYKMSTWDATVSDAPWVHVTWSDIKFDTNVAKTVFKK